MILTEIQSKSSSVNDMLENILIPQIIERIKNGETKIEYLLYEINDILDTDYSKGNLRLKLNNTLKDSKIRFSIKKKTFVFFEKFDECNKESSLFTSKFEKFIPTINSEIKKEYEFAIEENCFKEFFEIKYNIDNIYQRIRLILEEYDSNIKIGIRKNTIINGKNTNIIIFYDENNYNKIKEKNNEFRDEIRENVKKLEKKSQDVRKIELKETESIYTEIMNELPLYIPLPCTIICPICKNKVILKYPEVECYICKTPLLEKWED